MLSNSLMEKEEKAVDASEFVAALEERFSGFEAGQQGDASEVIIGLLDVFETSIGKDFIHGIFGGEMEQVVTYRKDADSGDVEESATSERFTALHIQVNEPTTFQHLYEQFEEPEGIEDYKDSSGKSHAVAIKHHLVRHWPKVILVVFEQYYYKFNIHLPLMWNGKSLVAAIIHKGSQHGGHYAVIVQNKGEWWLKEDDEVTLSEAKIEDFIAEVAVAAYR